jgi:hypothetical protein
MAFAFELLSQVLPHRFFGCPRGAQMAFAFELLSRVLPDRFLGCPRDFYSNAKAPVPVGLRALPLRCAASAALTTCTGCT